MSDAIAWAIIALSISWIGYLVAVVIFHKWPHLRKKEGRPRALGDPDNWIAISEAPTAEYPLRAMVSTHKTWIVLETPEMARAALVLGGNYVPLIELYLKVNDPRLHECVRRDEDD